MTNDNYVEIVRHFRDADEEVRAPLVRRLFRDLRPEESLTWDKLIAPADGSAVVLLAASGTGKSTEFKQQVARLRLGGVRSVYAEAGILATMGFQEGLAADDHAAYQSWLSSTDPIVAFIDAVDELHLHQRGVRHLIQCLERAFDLTTKRVQFIIGARNGAWSKEHTGALRNLLRRSGENDPKVTIVTFEPIDPTALYSMVLAAGVSNPIAFMEAFESDELDGLLDLRPCDVDLFVGYWKRHGSFGSWSDILADFVDVSFVDRNRERTCLLTQYQGASGLARLGAATILGKRQHVALPSSIESLDAISSRRLFADWPSPRLAELLENPLLVHKGTDAVQLPQGALTQFLAGRWFAERAAHGALADMAREALLVRVAGEDHSRIPEPRRAVTGWVASALPDLRSSLLDDHPDVVLSEGDPDRLADREIETALRRVLESIAKGHSPPWPTRGALRKLARPSLETALLSLFDKNRSTPKALDFLLLFAEAGKYPSIVSRTMGIARDTTLPGNTRGLAISVVASSGDEESIQSLLDLVDDPDEHIRCKLLEALTPGVLNGEKLIALLATGGLRQFRAAAERIAPRLGVAELDGILAIVLPVLISGTLSEETELKLNGAIPVALARLLLSEDFPDHVAVLLTAIEQLTDHGPYSFSTSDLSTLNRWFSGHPEARRSLWARRFAVAGHNALAFAHLTNPKFAGLREADLEWLLDFIRRTDEAQRGGARAALMSFCDGLGREGRQTVRDSGASPELTAYLNQRDRIHEEFDNHERDQQDQKRESDAATLANNRRELEPRLAGIRSGTDADAIVWAWSQLADTDTKSRGVRRDLASLEALIGKDYTTDAIQGLRAFWRGQTIDLPAPGANQTPYLYLAGLTGIALDVQAGLDLSSLSPAEAALAARYALYELNGLPYWFQDLIAAHEATVRKVLADAIASEWEIETECHGVLRLSGYAPRPIGLAIRGIVVDLLADRAPRHPTTIHYAVDALLVSRDRSTKIVSIIIRQIDTDIHDDDRLREWLRAWAHYEPIAAAIWLDAKIRKKKATRRIAKIVATVARDLEHDLDLRLGRSTETALTAPLALGRWIRLLHRVIRPQDDVHRRGVYSPNTRDYAQTFRRRCMDLLASNTSAEAGAALRSLRESAAMKPYKESIDWLIESHAALAAEAQSSVWSEADILRAEVGDERHPTTAEELFALVQKHVGTVRRLLENDDFSCRSLFIPTTHETQIQLWVASCLRLVARGLYSVVRENALDDNKEVDISAFADGVGRVPIEIKPLNRRNYPFNRLCDVIDDQLLGKYMQPTTVRYGVLLLFFHENRTWTIGRKSGLRIQGLVDALRAHAQTASRRAGKVVAIEAIDAVTLPNIIGHKKARLLPAGVSSKRSSL